MKTTATRYGTFQEEQLLEMQDTYDTQDLLHLVDEIADLKPGNAFNKQQFRDKLLRLHGMAHTVINGGVTPSESTELSMPGLATNLLEDLAELDPPTHQFERRELIKRFESALRPLASLYDEAEC